MTTGTSILDEFGGEFQFIYRNMLLIVSKMHAAPQDVIGELIANAIDSGASEIKITLEPDTIAVADNGHGMNPFITPEDMDYLRLYWEDIEAKRVDPNFDVRTVISPQSKASFGWMALNVAFSQKVPQPGQKLKGRLGIGAQSARTIADSLEWVSRTRSDMTAAYDGTTTSPGVAFRLVLPNLEDLEAWRLDPVIEPVYDRIVLPAGSDSGTTVHLSHLRESVTSSLRPTALVDYIRNNFGASIKEGLRVVVLDLVTDEGRRKHGNATVVPPPSYKGYPILQKVLYLKGGRAPFEVDLWFDPQGRGMYPKLRVLGSDKRNVTDLEEFGKNELLTNGRINGHVEFPNLPESEAPLNTEKSMPLKGTVRNQWANALEAALSEAAARMKEIEQRARNERVDTVVKAVADATLAAMKDLDAFRDVTIADIGVDRKKRPSRPGKPTQPQKPSEYVIVTVFDEHNRGVAGVPIQLRQHGQLLAERLTGTSGQVSFGGQDNGRYQLEMAIPKGMTSADGVKDYTFNLSDNQRGIRAIFRLFTGRDRPEIKKIRRIMTYVHPLSDPNQPWSAAKLDASLFEINSEHEAYRAALEAGDADLIHILAAQYLAAGVSQFGLSAEPSAVQHQNASVLFARVLSFGRRTRTQRPAR